MIYDSPTRRVVLLGASNLTRSFSTVVATVRSTWDEPVEIMAAIGHGRSFGQDSSVLGRKISGIFPCALWQDLQNRPQRATTALITDIGNDLLYGVPPEQLLEWVAACHDRLVDAGAEPIITELPVGSIEQLSERRFRFFRRLFFPRSSLTLADARVMIREMNARVRELGERRKTPVIPVSPAWYGLDPIHIKRTAKPHAWSQLLASWRTGGDARPANRVSPWTAAYLTTLAPHERSILGIRRRARQPSGRLSDGTTISLY